ncbi:hypothetical protein G7068_08835 [Leucobacter viscericola]|uniref:SD-repeat containing protein B domain-containing protein n=1 Tax=Leucobacter viscericola TaxID=2714935 RepID=A0A6G7XFK9_9MICO|nr:Ig-like domain-containing protein [Leucobacter viscericola]QIK63292.1 hypothetical protein G7068_08835 [Leucobacter viscericola]
MSNTVKQKLVTARRRDAGTAGRFGITQKPWAALAAVLVGLLAFSGLTASPALADPGDLGLSVKNGGVTTVSAFTDTVPFEVQISLPSGTALKPGAVTKLVLDRSLKRTNNGPLPVGATAHSWDEQSNTYTVTWGALVSGSVYSATVNAIPSATATLAETFQATATTTGVTTDNAPITQTVSSAPITATGTTIPATLTQPLPGQWTAPAPTFTLNPGVSSTGWPQMLQAAGAKTAFRNLQVSTQWGVQSGTDNLLPRSWVNTGPQMVNEGVFVNRTVLQDDASARTFAYGAFGWPSTSALMQFTVTVPVGAAPGTYSVPFQVLDDADASGATKTIVSSSALKVVVPEPAATNVAYVATQGATQAVAGEPFDWVQRIGISAITPPVKNFTVISKTPAGAIPRGFTSNYIDGTGGVATLKSVEYTTDASVTESSSWQTLPLSGGLSGQITLADPSVITGFRYVLNDFGIAINRDAGGASISFQADPGLAEGATLRFDTPSVTYRDAVVGDITMTPNTGFGKTVTIVAESATPSQIESTDTPVGNGAVSFDRTYANGKTLSARLFLGSDGVKAFKQPYIFFVTPKGMAASNLNPSICGPMAWANQSDGCSRGFVETYPTVAANTGSIPLSDGSTLNYVRITSGQLGYGAVGFQQLLTSPNLKLNTMLAGTQKVLVGMGSLSQDAFTVNAARTKADYSKKSLSAAASYGAYSGLSSEIHTALQGLGITTDNAMMGEKTFTVSPSTSVGSVTSIKGSEDAAAIVQGAGTATARPGGSVSYKVDVSNTGSQTYKDFQFIDVLPANGDKYTLNSAVSRGSAFDVNLSGNVQVLVNGAPSSGATVEYTTSTTPARFDAAGADIAGDAWTPYTGTATGAKALRVTLASGVNFNPGDKITLSFDATVPASAPRDGSTAKNTIAYRFQVGAGVWAAAETPSVPVKSSAPAGDTQLSGLAFLDLNGDGIQNAGEPGLNGSGVALQLYKMVSGSPVAVGSPVTPNLDAGTDGVFSFIGLDPNLSYRVKPVSSNSNVTFTSSALDADGFLKYVQITDAAVNGSENTTQYVGSSSYLIGDQVGAKKWIKDLRLPLVAKTTVSGSLQLTDTVNTPLTAGTGSAAAPYVKDYTVKLMKGATQVATTTTNESGAYTFTGIAGLTPGDYSVVFTSPSGRKLVASPLNNTSVFSGATTPAVDGVYKLTNMQPGTGATGVSVYYTDTDAPVASVAAFTGGVTVGSARYNPASATLSGTDVGTFIKSYAWQVLDASSTVVASGNAAATGAADTPAVTIPGSLADGAYTLAVAATDLVGNVSAVKYTAFSVDKTAPAVASTATSVTYAKGSPAAPTTAAGWIALYGVTASDAGSGMPAGGGITVDSSAVKTGTAGTYTLKFTATDAAGNATASYNVSYVVAYVGDPTISLGSNAAFFEMGTTQPANDAAVKALFGGVTTGTSGGATVASVAVDASAVNYAVAGPYAVVFTVTDSLGYTASVTGTLTVRDTIKPTIASTSTALTFHEGDAQVSDEAGWIAAFGATAADSGSGLASLTADASAVNYATAGTYLVVFTATDNAGNTQTKSVTYTVAFAGAPAITLGNDPVVYEMGDTKPASKADWIALFDAKATTAAGTTLKSLTVDSTAVDFNTLSMTGYNVTFTATDSYDNTFTYTGKYVVQDTKKPSVTIGKDTAKHTQREPLTPMTTQDWLSLFDVTAQDTTGGSGIDADAWTVTEGVNYNAAGDYTIEFVAHDKAGNASAKQTATLTIQAPPTADSVAMKVAQNQTIVLDPNARTETTGSLKDLTASALGTPSAGGKVALDGKGGVTYTPAKDFFGQETVVITVTDDLSQTAEITYTFTVVKKGKVLPKLPEYFVPVDGTATIPTADVLGAVDVDGLTIDKVATPAGFHGKVKLDGDTLAFATDGTDWHGDESFTVTVKDELAQSVEVPVTLHVLMPTLTSDKANGYAASTEVTVTANGLVPGRQYSVELHSSPILLGKITADVNGSGQLTALIPSEAKAGNHEIVLLNDAAQTRGAVKFEVLTKDQPPVIVPPTKPTVATAAWLSLTGGNGPGLALAIGLPLLLAAAGLFVVLWLRRKKRESDQEVTN